MKLPFNIICLDIETTDVDMRLGSVIQIGAILLTSEFEEIDSFTTFIQPLDSYRNQSAMNVNKISEDSLIHAPTLQEALEMFETFVLQEKVVNKEKIILAAWGNYFDVPFLKQQYVKIKRKWPFGYKSLDLKTLAIWEFGKRDIPMGSGLIKSVQLLNMEFEGQHHDALADIKNSINVLKKILKQEPKKTGWS